MYLTRIATSIALIYSITRSKLKAFIWNIFIIKTIPSVIFTSLIRNTIQPTLKLWGGKFYTDEIILFNLAFSVYVIATTVFRLIYFDTSAICTGKSLSEALTLKSTNPQYDNRLFIKLRVQYMKIPSTEHVENKLRRCCQQWCWKVENIRRASSNGWG